MLARSRILPFLALVLVVGTHSFAQGVAWKPFDKGMKDAAAGKKYSFIDVYTDWCGYCKLLESQTLRAQPVMAELQKNFVSIKLNAESDDVIMYKGKKTTQRELAGIWGVEGFPTMLFLNHKGDIIGSYASFADAELMLNLLRYISTGAREKKKSFADFLKEPT